MRHTRKITLSLLINLLIATPLLADGKVEVSAKLLHFDYEEFDTSGQSFNKEGGFIPGFSISTAKALEHFTNTIGLEAYNGQVDYDGQTQSGIPHTTITNESLYRLLYKLDWSPEQIKTLFFGKISWQQWDRDILSANNVSGLFEQYRWWAFEAGILTTLFESGTDKWQFELGASKTANGTIKVDLQEFGYGQPLLNLGNGYGIAAALKYRYKMTNRDDIGISIEHRYWTFSRSNSKTLSNNQDTITIAEPHSVTQHSIISVNYIYYFE